MQRVQDTRIMRLPTFSPASSPISAFGVFSEPFHDVFLDLELAALDPALKLGQRLVVLILIIRHDEALHGEPLHDDEAGNAARPVCGGCAVILRYRPATGDASVIVHAEQHGFENVAAHIVEIDVDALRRRLAERLAHGLGLVVDGRIEAEFVGEELAFRRAARDADHGAALDLGDLPDDGADGARRGGDDHRLAGLRLADFKKPEIGGQPSNAIDAEKVGEGLHLRQLLRRFRGHRRIILPARIRENEVALGKARRLCLHHFGDRAARHHRPGLHRRAIGRALHPGPVRRIERDHLRLQQKLAILCLWHLAVRLELEMALGELSLRRFCQQHLAVGGHGGFSLCNIFC